MGSIPSAVSMTDIEKLKAIRDKCKKLVRIAKSITTKDWSGVTGECDYFGDTLLGLIDTYEDWQNDVQFVESAAEFALPAWESTAILIDSLIHKFKDHVEFEDSTNITSLELEGLRKVIKTWSNFLNE